MCLFVLVCVGGAVRSVKGRYTVGFVVDGWYLRYKAKKIMPLQQTTGHKRRAGLSRLSVAMSLYQRYVGIPEIIRGTSSETAE